MIDNEHVLAVHERRVQGAIAAIEGRLQSFKDRPANELEVLGRNDLREAKEALQLMEQESSRIANDGKKAKAAIRISNYRRTLERLTDQTVW